MKKLRSVFRAAASGYQHERVHSTLELPALRVSPSGRCACESVSALSHGAGDGTNPGGFSPCCDSVAVP